jgi:diguanylate cyclase (GGDEF)-like protein
MKEKFGRLLPALLQGTVFLGVAMIALLWVSIITLQRIDRQARIDAAALNTSNLARAFGEHTARTILGEDSTLIVLRKMLQHNASSFASVDWENLPDSVLQYSVIDENGKLAGSSVGQKTDADAADREHVLHHMSSTDDALYIGRPIAAHPSQPTAIKLSRKLIGPGGKFAGVIIASLDQRKLTSFYEGIHVGKDGSISLIGLDGHVRASRGFKRNVALVPSDSPMQRRAQSSPEGSYITSGSFDGIPRILSYRKVENLPLIVTTAVSKSEILASHYSDTSKVRIIGGGITAMILAVMGFSVSNRMRLDRAHASLLESEISARRSSEQLRTTLENMDQGIIMVDPDGFVQVINRRAAQLLDIPDAWLETRMKLSDMRALLWDRGEFEGSQQPHIRKMFAESGIYSGPATYQRTRPNGMVLEVRNMHLPDGGLVRTFSDITARHQAEERIRHLALHDELTELANRAAFRERIEHCFQKAHRHGECFALLIFDMDRFKTINDRMGHLAGDGVLREIGRRLKACVRDVDLAARLGGDEFAIVQSDIRSVEDVADLAQRILDKMREPFDIGDATIGISVSIGIALAPRHASHIKDLAAAADAALYRAKHGGGDGFCFHEDRALRTVA